MSPCSVLLLTPDFADGHGGGEDPGLAAAPRVDGHHAHMQEVVGRQALQAQVGGKGQLLVSHHPVGRCGGQQTLTGTVRAAGTELATAQVLGGKEIRR